MGLTSLSCVRRTSDRYELDLAVFQFDVKL